VYLLGPQGQPKAISVRLGISDGSSTELLLDPNTQAAGELTEGTELLIGIKTAGHGSKKPAATSPRAPF
jgi:HlyD family secretion protein